MGDMLIGTCTICGRTNVPLSKKYYSYEGVKCACHGYPHTECVEHCKYCEPKEPVETKLYISTEVLRKLIRDADAGCNIRRIKVTFAKIVVTGNKNKPYFQIEYYDIEGQERHLGFGSYLLDNVFQWLDECFEIVEEENNG